MNFTIFNTVSALSHTEARLCFNEGGLGDFQFSAESLETLDLDKYQPIEQRGKLKKKVDKTMNTHLAVTTAVKTTEKPAKTFASLQKQLAKSAGAQIQAIDIDIDKFINWAKKHPKKVHPKAKETLKKKKVDISFLEQTPVEQSTEMSQTPSEVNLGQRDENGMPTFKQNSQPQTKNTTAQIDLQEAQDLLFLERNKDNNSPAAIKEIERIATKGSEKAKIEAQKILDEKKSNELEEQKLSTEKEPKSQKVNSLDDILDSHPKTADTAQSTVENPEDIQARNFMENNNGNIAGSEGVRNRFVQIAAEGSDENKKSAKAHLQNSGFDEAGNSLNTEEALGEEEQSIPETNESQFNRSLQVNATAYNSLRGQTDSTPDIAAWGDKLKPGMKCIAVSRDLLNTYGLRHNQEVQIDGLEGTYRVLDKMNKRFTKKIDIYMGNDKQKALQWGNQTVTIRWNDRKQQKPLPAQNPLQDIPISLSPSSTEPNQPTFENYIKNIGGAGTQAALVNNYPKEFVKWIKENPEQYIDPAVKKILVEKKLITVQTSETKTEYSLLSKGSIPADTEQQKQPTEVGSSEDNRPVLTQKSEQQNSFQDIESQLSRSSAQQKIAAQKYGEAFVGWIQANPKKYIHPDAIAILKQKGLYDNTEQKNETPTNSKVAENSLSRNISPEQINGYINDFENANAQKLYEFFHNSRNWDIQENSNTNEFKVGAAQERAIQIIKNAEINLNARLDWKEKKLLTQIVQKQNPIVSYGTPDAKKYYATLAKALSVVSEESEELTEEQKEEIGNTSFINAKDHTISELKEKTIDSISSSDSGVIKVVYKGIEVNKFVTIAPTSLITISNLKKYLEIEN